MEKYNLLIVDDDEGIRDAVKEYLICQGFNTFIAHAPTELVETIQKNNIHLLLMDINLSGYDGRYICKTLKQQYHLKLPVLLFSASNTYNAKNVKPFLADDFIEKPFSVYNLKLTILHHLDVVIQPIY